MPDNSSPRRSDEVERRLLHLVDEALKLPADARGAFLRQACAGDAGLHGSAAELLAACEDAEGAAEFLAGSAAEFAAPLTRSTPEDGDPGTDPDAARLAERLTDRFRFGREIGRGGHASVHFARDLAHGRDVAVKVIRSDLADPAQRRRFLQEIEFAARLRHPYIVPLLESGEAGGVLYYVMPYVEGESLRDRLDREGPLPLADVLALAGDLAEAIDFAHANGVIHRDIKPQNVLLSGRHALVADFGIALALEGEGGARITAQGVTVGTPAYMSPEQAEARPVIDGRSDIYSLGCVVYEMLTGEVPFPGETPRAILAKHLQAPVPELAILRPSIAPGVQRALAQALAKLPAERYASASAFVEALRQAPEARAALPAGRWWRWGAGAALLASLALGAYLLRPRHPVVVAAAPDPHRIAVLYFDNLTSDPDLGLLARGLSEDLIDELSAVRGLRVISPNGVRPFRDKPVPVDSIARALRVGTVVGGSVSASGNTLRVSVRLVDPVDGDQVDGQAIEVARGAALDLRKDVVTRVAGFLRSRLGEEIRLRRQRSETASLAAWERLQRAHELDLSGVEASLRNEEANATDLFLRADSLYAVVERLDPAWVEPTISRGWVALRLALSPPDLIRLPDEPVATRRQPATLRMPRRAIRFADQALRRSAGSARALALRGFAREWLATWPEGGGQDTLRPLAEADLRAALDERADDARSWYALGDLLYAEGRNLEASRALQSAYEADAYLSEIRGVMSLLFFTSLSLEQFDAARDWCRRGLERFPGDPRFVTCPVLLRGWTGGAPADVGSAWQEIASIERGDSAGMYASQWGGLRMLVAVIAARAGMNDSARAIIDAVHRGTATHPGTGFRTTEAYAQLLLGEKEAALRLLTEELGEDPAQRGPITRSPWFRQLAGDPLFRDGAR